MNIIRVQALLFTAVGMLAQQSQSPSTGNLSKASDGTKTLEIHNVSFLSTNSLLLRKTTNSKHVLGDKGVEGTVAVEAWPLGTDPRQKPLYAVKAAGTDAQIVDYSKYPDLKGQWERFAVRGLAGQPSFDQTKP